MVQWKQIQLGTMRLPVRSLASLSELRIWCCRELWCRLAAVALIRPIAWELPYALGMALKTKKKKKKKKRKKKKRNYKVRYQQLINHALPHLGEKY